MINFMVYSKGSMVFLKSVDASNNIKDHKYIYKLLKNVIKEVRVDNVKILAKILRIHFKGHWIPTKRLTPQVLAKVVDLALLVLLLLVTTVERWNK